MPPDLAESVVIHGQVMQSGQNFRHMMVGGFHFIENNWLQGSCGVFGMLKKEVDRDFPEPPAPTP